MAPNTNINYEEMWKLTKGDFVIDNIHITFDLTNGLSKNEFIRKQKSIFEKTVFFIRDDGRLISPQLNIL